MILRHPRIEPPRHPEMATVAALGADLSGLAASVKNTLLAHAIFVLRPLPHDGQMLIENDPKALAFRAAAEHPRGGGLYDIRSDPF